MSAADQMPGSLPNMNANLALGRLLNPRSVAVIGASDDALRIGGGPSPTCSRRAFRAG